MLLYVSVRSIVDDSFDIHFIQYIKLCQHLVLFLELGLLYQLLYLLLPLLVVQYQFFQEAS